MSNIHGLLLRNGFPFPLVDGELWDGSTFTFPLGFSAVYDADPPALPQPTNGPGHKPACGPGTDHPLGLTLLELACLFYRVKEATAALSWEGTLSIGTIDDQSSDPLVAGTTDVAFDDSGGDSPSLKHTNSDERGLLVQRCLGEGGGLYVFGDLVLTPTLRKTQPEVLVVTTGGTKLYYPYFRGLAGSGYVYASNDLGAGVVSPHPEAGDGPGYDLLPLGYNVGWSCVRQKDGPFWALNASTDGSSGDYGYGPGITNTLAIPMQISDRGHCGDFTFTLCGSLKTIPLYAYALGQPLGTGYQPTDTTVPYPFEQPYPPTVAPSGLSALMPNYPHLADVYLTSASGSITVTKYWTYDGRYDETSGAFL